MSLQEKVNAANEALFAVEQELKGLGQEDLRRRVYGLRVDLNAATWRREFETPWQAPSQTPEKP